jgi:hypothetical protein
MLSLAMAALAAAIIGPAPAAAGNSVFSTVSVGLFDNDAWGWGPANTNLKVTLRGADGDYQGHFLVMSDGSGYWEGNFWGDVQAGDKVIVTDGSTSRTVNIQPLSYSINRVTDVISGRSVPNSNVDIFVWGCQDEWDDCDGEVDVVRSTNGEGKFSFDTTSQYDLRGQDEVRVRWDSNQGDEVYRWLDVPYQGGFVNSNDSWGVGKPRAEVTAYVFNSQGTQKDKFRSRADIWDGDWYGAFANNGRAVNIRPGDFLGSSIASDSLFQIVNTNASFNTTDDTVSGKCFKNKLFTIYIHHPDGSYYSAYTGGTANSNGNFTVDVMDSSGWDLQSGDLVDIRCRTPKGDEQETPFEVP